MSPDSASSSREYEGDIVDKSRVQGLIELDKACWNDENEMALFFYI